MPGQRSPARRTCRRFTRSSLARHASGAPLPGRCAGSTGAHAWQARQAALQGRLEVSGEARLGQRESLRQLPRPGMRSGVQSILVASLATQPPEHDAPVAAGCVVAAKTGQPPRSRPPARDAPPYGRGLLGQDARTSCDLLGGPLAIVTFHSIKRGQSSVCVRDVHMRCSANLLVF